MVWKLVVVTPFTEVVVLLAERRQRESKEGANGVKSVECCR